MGHRNCLICLFGILLTEFLLGVSIKSEVADLMSFNLVELELLALNFASFCLTVSN